MQTPVTPADATPDQADIILVQAEARQGHRLFQCRVGQARFERQPTITQSLEIMVGRRGETPLVPPYILPNFKKALAPRRHRRGLIVGSITALGVSYPLGVGTAVFLQQNGLLPDALGPMLRFIYFPVVFAMRRVPLIYSFYEWYLGIELS